MRLLCFLLGLASPVAAQVTGPPHVFVANTVASPDEVNLNFSTIYDAALNRSGGTMTGTLTGVSATFSGTLGVTGATTLGSTLGVTGASTLAALSATTGTFSSTLGVTGAATLSSTLAVTGAATLTSTLAVNSTSAAAIDVAGGITAGSGNVAVIGTDGRIPSISSTYFASLSGADLTSIPETAITDGSLLARVGSAETISAGWTFASQTTINNNVALVTKNSGGTTVNLANIDNSNNYNFGSANSAQVSNTILAAGSAIDFQTNGASRGNFNSAGAFSLLYAFALPNTISPAALSTGNNNNYSPTGWADAFLVRLDGGAGSPTLTGLTAPSGGGFLKVLCRVAGNGITVANEDANSTAANRVIDSGGALVLNAVADGDCALIVYDSVSARWRNISVTQ